MTEPLSLMKLLTNPALIQEQMEKAAHSFKLIIDHFNNKFNLQADMLNTHKKELMLINGKLDIILASIDPHERMRHQVKINERTEEPNPPGDH